MLKNTGSKIKMKLILNMKEANAIWVALRFYAYETTHDHGDGVARTGLPDVEEKKLIDSVLTKLLKGVKK